MCSSLFGSHLICIGGNHDLSPAIDEVFSLNLDDMRVKFHNMKHKFPVTDSACTEPAMYGDLPPWLKDYKIKEDDQNIRCIFLFGGKDNLGNELQNNFYRLFMITAGPEIQSLEWRKFPKD